MARSQSADDDDTPDISQSVRLAKAAQAKASAARKSLFITGALFATGTLLAFGGLLRATKSFSHPPAVQPAERTEEQAAFVPFYRLETQDSTAKRHYGCVGSTSSVQGGLVARNDHVRHAGDGASAFEEAQAQGSNDFL